MCENWTENQKKVYLGLKDIGGEAAGYFKSAMNYYYDASLPNRVSHLALDAREIDGGLRDIFSPEYLKRKKEHGFLSRSMKKIFGSEFKDNKGHIASILTALDVDEKDELAKEWVTIATNFSKFVHRHGIWKEARDFSEFKPLWDRYENVLLKLVGSFYAIIARIDRLVKLELIPDASTGALLNLLRISSYCNYFFRTTNGLQWFEPLNNNGIFDPKNINFDEHGNASFWSVLDYLKRISEQVAQSPFQNSKYGKELLSIIENTVQFSRSVKKINHYHIWWYCVKILNNLPASVITVNLPVDTFKMWLHTLTDRSGGSDLTISDIGEKLLGKFLQDNSTLKYAEAIIAAITGICPGRKKRTSIFSEREDAELAWDSYWILQAFQKHHKTIGQKCSSDAVLDIADKLKNALEYKQKNYYVHIKTGSDRYRLKVFRITEDNLEPAEIKFKEKSFKCILKQFSQEQLKDIDVEKDFWALHQAEPSIEVKHFSFRAERRDEFVSEIKSNLPGEIDWAGTEKFEEKLGLLFDGLYEDYSHIWFKSLLGGGHGHLSGAQEVLTIILRDVLLAKCEADRTEAKQILDSFMGDRYRFPIFKRLVLICTDRYWLEYFPLLEKFLDEPTNHLHESDYEVELYDVLHNHNQDFSPAFKAKLRELIENVPEYYLKEGEKLTAYWKYKWLSALKDNPDFSVAYNEAKEKAQPKGGEPYEPERSAFQGGIVVHKSPLSKEDVLSKPIAELVKYLNDFQGADFWHSRIEGEPDKEGLAEALQAAVKVDPKKFTDEIEVFHEAPYLYVHQFLRGLKEAWNEKKDLDWEKVFDFCLKYVGRDKESFLKEAFQVQGDDSGKGKYIWIVEDIVDLIADGSRDDARAFEARYFEKAEQVFNLVMPLLKGDKRPDTQRDAMTYALNTTLGRVIMAYIRFSLRVARVTQKKEADWGNNRYERFFGIGIESCIWFGCYLPQMRYLDPTYANEKINRLAEKAADDFEWCMFMEGYLGGSQVYKDLYFLMRPHYLKALESNIFEERTDQRLVEHIAIGYLEGDESLRQHNNNGQESLFWKMLAEAKNLGKHDRWVEVAGFFGSLTGRRLKKEDRSDGEDASEKTKKKILEFWEWAFNQQDFVRDQLGNKYDSFLGRMAELTILLDKIDETNEKWLLLSVPHVGLEHHASFLIEYLTKFEDEESIRRIGKIYLTMLENNIPTFRQENIELIIRRIYDKGNRDDAEAICNTYGRKGIYFLRPVLEEYQKKKNIN